MAAAREKFSSQAFPELLAGMRQIARQEGRHFQAVLEDAMIGYIESKAREKVRPEVMAHYRPASKRTGCWLSCWLSDQQLSNH